MEFILSTYLPSSSLLLGFLPVCMQGFIMPPLGGLRRMWLPGAYSSSQRVSSSPEGGCTLTATADVTMPLLSSGHPTALRAALVQEGNYLSTPITSTSAILLTSVPDESPSLAVQEFLDQFREWSHGTLLLKWNRACTVSSQAQPLLPAESHR